MLAGSLELDTAMTAELTAELATVEAQVSSSRPKRSILHESLSSIRAILESAAGSGAAIGATHLPTAISALEHAISSLA